MGTLGTYLSASQAMRVGKAWLRTVLRLPDQSSLPLMSDPMHQNTNGYGDTSYVSRHNGGGLPQVDGFSHAQGLPYPIQTSWPYGNNSSDTSVNQTPAGNSAGVDPSNGFFGQGNFDVGPFDDTLDMLSIQIPQRWRTPSGRWIQPRASAALPHPDILAIRQQFLRYISQTDSNRNSNWCGS